MQIEGHWLSDSEDPLDPRPTIKVTVKAEYRPDLMAFHNSDVHAITGGQQSPILNNLPSPQDVCFLDREDIIHNLQQDLKRGINRVSFAYGSIPMHDLLKHFGVGHEALSRRDQALQEHLRLTLVRVRRADEVHRDIGIHKDQA